MPAYDPNVFNITPYFDDYIEYFRKAKILEERVKLGGEEPTGLVGDELMEKVAIYDVTDRQHAGINDMIQDLWFNHKVPKAKFRKTGGGSLLLVLLFQSWTQKLNIK